MGEGGPSSSVPLVTEAEGLCVTLAFFRLGWVALLTWLASTTSSSALSVCSGGWDNVAEGPGVLLAFFCLAWLAWLAWVASSPSFSASSVWSGGWDTVAEDLGVPWTLLRLAWVAWLAWAAWVASFHWSPSFSTKDCKLCEQRIAPTVLFTVTRHG